MPQKRHFTSMIESLIELEGRRTISRINRNTSHGTDVSNDIKFIRNTDWTKGELLSANREYLKSLAGTTETGFLSRRYRH